MLAPLERQRPLHERIMHRRKTAPLPPEVEPYKDTIKVTSWGKMTIASAPFGKLYTNEDVVQIAIDKGLDPAKREEALKIMNASGITTRFAHSLESQSPQEVLERSAAIGALLIGKIMQEKKWQTVDRVYIASSILPEEVGNLTLTRAGLDPQKVSVRNYRLACAGAVAAFIDSLADAELSGKNVIVVALEPLASRFRDEHFSSEKLGIPTIFGEDFAGLGYRPSDYELLTAKTVAKYDKGVIKLHKDYLIPPHDEYVRSHVKFRHYDIAAGEQRYISISDRGVFYDITEPEDVDSMDGLATALWFKYESFPILQWLLQQALADQAIFHQPSKPVIDGIRKLFDRAGLAHPPIEFLLDKMKRSNSVSATSLVTWQYMAEEGLLKDPHKPTLIFAPAIGSVFAGAVFRQRRDNTRYWQIFRN